MSVNYKREINHNYLIIDASEEAAAGYECKMLAGNTIEGLLKFRVRHHEDKKEFYYEITSKQPLARLLEQRTITGEEIRVLMLGISGLVGRLEEFLLQENQIYLEPEYIYIEPDRFSVFFCMVPGYSNSFPAALTALFEYLLSRVNHQDKNGVMLAYNLYHESLKENYGMQDLLEFLNEKSSGIFDIEKPDDRQKRMEKSRENGMYKENEIDRNNEIEEDNERCKDFNTDVELEIRRKIGVNNEKENSRDKKANRDKEANRRKEVNRDKEVNRRKEVNRDKEVNRCKEVNRGNAGKRERNADRKIIAHVIMVTGACELALWFLMGTEGLLRFGPWMIVATLVLSGIRFLVNLFFIVENTDTIGPNIENHEKKKETIRETFKIVQEEKAETEVRAEEEEYWEGRRKSDKMEVISEPKTELLADLDKPKRLAVMEGLNKEKESIEITYLPFVIGKHEELSDYCLHQPTVSRLHLRVDKKEDVYIVTDLNSTNGTTVEGYHLQANETVSVKHGDLIYLADVGFRFAEDKM